MESMNFLRDPSGKLVLSFSKFLFLTFSLNFSTKPNSLGYTGKHNTGIKFEHHFAIDWLDHNVLLYRDNAIRLVSLTKSRFTRQIYNGSRKVRNLLVSDKGLFFAWIENENNIHRAAKVCLSCQSTFLSVKLNAF